MIIYIRYKKFIKIHINIVIINKFLFYILNIFYFSLAAIKKLFYEIKNLIL